jgi:putative thioredoxin
VKLFRNVRVVDEFVGAQPLAGVRAFLQPHLPRASAAEHEAARELARHGDFAGAIASLRTITHNDPANLDARRDLARYLALSGDVVSASKVLGQLPPQAQSEPDSNAVRAVIHFAALATEEAARQDSARASAARSLLGGSHDAAIESLLARMQADHAFAVRAGREDLLQAFALLPAGDPRVTSWRRRLAAVLN